MKWFNKLTERIEDKFMPKGPKYETPEEYFADCDGDVVKMADKFLLDVNIRTFSQLVYLQKKLIEEQRKCLTKHL